MKVEEIALRHEIRQMMNEAGINKNVIRDMVEKVLKEEIEKQVKNALNQTKVTSIIRENIRTYEFRDRIRSAISDVIRKELNISIKVEGKIGD